MLVVPPSSIATSFRRKKVKSSPQAGSKSRRYQASCALARYTECGLSRWRGARRKREATIAEFSGKKSSVSQTSEGDIARPAALLLCSATGGPRVRHDGRTHGTARLRRE